jgi:hypothetical protein
VFAFQLLTSCACCCCCCCCADYCWQASVSPTSSGSGYTGAAAAGMSVGGKRRPGVPLEDEKEPSPKRHKVRPAHGLHMPYNPTCSLPTLLLRHPAASVTVSVSPVAAACRLDLLLDWQHVTWVWSAVCCINTSPHACHGTECVHLLTYVCCLLLPAAAFLFAGVCLTTLLRLWLRCCCCWCWGVCRWQEASWCVAGGRS